MDRRHFVVLTGTGLTAFAHDWLLDPERVTAAGQGQRVDQAVVDHLERVTDEAHTIVDRLLDALPSGSYLAISHPTTEIDGAAMEESEPGVVSCSLWRPEPSRFGAPVEVYEFGGVGRKP